MFTRSSLLLFVLAAQAGWAQEAPQPASSATVNFPANAPVALVSADWRDSRTEARGGALVLDLHTSLSLRNVSQQRIRGITLLVQSQEVTAGGKASVTVPSLDIHPNETFPVRVDLRLLRPMPAAMGALAEVRLDGVLFDDLSFYGPNVLNSRRAMTAWELEARRDRRYFQSVLEARGRDGLRQEMVDVLARLTDRPRLDVQVGRRGRATAALPQERSVQFAFLRIPDAPVEAVSGTARVAAGEASSPHVQVLNRSDRTVRYFEIGLVIRDRDGREFPAGSVPATEAGLKLAPGAKSDVVEEGALRFTRQPGAPISIEGITGFVSQVEFADGTIWIPSRTALLDPKVRAAVIPSPEEQRLADLYRKKGLAVLVNELKKF